MKPSQHPIFKKFLTSVSLALVCIAPMAANTSITHKGATYHISGDTILLDREGLFDSPDAVKDPAEAFDRINRNGKRAVLLVAPSVYWLDDPEDPAIRSDKDGIPYAVRLNCDTLSIIGLAERPEDVVFAVNRGQTQGAVGNFTMFHFKGSSLTTQDMTFGNYCNVDLEYPRDPKQNRPKRKDAIVQAQIGICEGTDRLFAENTRFISRLNLCPFVGARRSLYDGCYFECTDDALSGSAVYLDCDFTFFSSKPFYSTAETGAVFLNCDITCLGSGTQYFTKVPGLVTAIDTRFHAKNPIEIKWTRDDSDIICRQENITLNGQPYIIKSPNSSTPRQESPEDSDPGLTSPEGSNLVNPGLQPGDDPLHSVSDPGGVAHPGVKKAYKVDSIYNLPNLLNGPDNWDPKGMNKTIADIEAKIGQKLTGIPVTLRIETEAPDPLHDGDQILVRSTPLLWGGYATDATEEFTVLAQNSKPSEKKLIIPVSTPEGLTAQTTLTIAPTLRQAPKFKKTPKISFDESQRRFRIDYSLAGKGDDNSRIVWCRVMNEDGKPRVFAMKEAEAPHGKTFTAKSGDLGYGIMAVVFPKFKDSKPGPMETSPVFYIIDPSQVESSPESHLSTDFSDVSIVKREPGIPGIWSFDVFKPSDTAHVDWEATEGPGWYYGKGFDASTGVGLIQSEKGARMSYVPTRDVCQDMSVSLIAEPAKSGGQGFGSATTQYMDICVKFDPVNLDGYALRIERTPDHDRAISFSLIKYTKGRTERISKEVISDCYRTPCHITVAVKDHILQANAYTEAPAPDRKCCNEVCPEVELTAKIEQTPLTGFAIQHTGSTGPSSTLLRSLTIDWQ